MRGDYLWESSGLNFWLFLKWKVIVIFVGGGCTLILASCFLGFVLWSNLKVSTCFQYFSVTQVRNWLSFRFMVQELLSFRERFHLESWCPDSEGASRHSSRSKQLNCSLAPQGPGVLENHWWPNSETTQIHFTLSHRNKTQPPLQAEKQKQALSETVSSQLKRYLDCSDLWINTHT